MTTQATSTTPRIDDLLVRELSVSSVREDAREADFICSTDALDSHGEIVEQDWDLKRYLANPVVLWLHDRYDLPIGSAKSVGVVDGKLQATIVFASEKANPQAERVWQSVVEKTLRAVSVGFRPGEYRIEIRGGVEVGVCSKCELREISVVPIPSNPETLTRMREVAMRLRAAPPTPVPTAVERGGESGIAREETPMDEKQKAALEAKIAERETEAKALEKQLADERTKTAALETQNTVLATERDALKAQVEASEAKSLDLEIEALVGVKITPAEKADFVELAKTSRPLFERMVAQRSELKLLGDAVTGKGAPAASAPIETSLASEIASQMGDA